MQFRLRTRYVLTLVALVAMMTAFMLVTQRATFDRVVSGFEVENLARLDAVLTENARKQAVQTSRITADRLLEPLFAEDISVVGNIIRPLVEREDVRAVVVYDRDGKVFHDGSQKLPSFGDPAPGDVQSAMADLSSRVATNAFDLRVIEPIAADGYLFGAIAVTFNARYIGAEVGAMQVELSKVADSALGELELRLGIAGLLALVMAGIAAAVLGGRMSRPVSDLAGAVQSISSGNFAVEMSSRRTDELGELARAFDEMAWNLRETMISRSQLQVTVAEQTRELRQTHETLVELEAKRRDVLDDIGTDLRGPIAAIENDIMLALRKQDSAMELRHSMSRILFEIRNVRRLVDDLRFAARSDSPRRLGSSSE